MWSSAGRRSRELNSARSVPRPCGYTETMRLPIALWALFLMGTAATGQVPARSLTPSDSEIRGILVDRIDKYRQSVGIVVGIIEPAGRRIISYGQLDQNDSRPLDGETVFEIGSNTKVFTALLLSEMVQRGEVALEDAVARYLPPTVKVPERGRRQITLVDLATHTSGLPRDPSNLDPKDLRNPYAGYSLVQLYDFISGYRLTRDIGSRFEYSSVGSALLGNALARRAGVDYETLIAQRITTPLSMSSTRVSLTPDQKPRLAVGHGYVTKEPVPPFETDAYAPAGGLRSTANDLLRFLAANLGFWEGPLASASVAMRNVHRGPMLLGWGAATLEGSEIVHHNGGTIGMNSFIGLDPKTRVGVVVLSNTGSGGPIDDIGFHLVNPRVPIRAAKELEPPKERKQVTVDPKIFEDYAGRYRISKDDIITVSHEGGRLFVQRAGEIKDEMFPESEQDYFAKLFDDQISFRARTKGKVSEIVYHENGKTLRAKRID
jgi:D-alanyl-D-alanine-carboxypeptidase/D-alanyl-D-alanine-endopeptidase